MSTRRTFLLHSAAFSGGLIAANWQHGLRPLRAESSDDQPLTVQLTSDIEPLVRLIEETPREQCFAKIAERIRHGLPYRQFLAALYLAGIRNVNPQPPGFKFHCVFVIHAAHQLSLDAANEDRLLPLFWSLDNFKSAQQKDVEEGDFRLLPVRGTIPGPEIARREFEQAMENWDQEKADRAIVALVRNESSHRIIESLWAFGARDYRNIGHKAIFVANTWRTLQTIGWRHAEPALRSLVLGLLDFGKQKQVNDYAFEDQTYLPNLERVRREIGRLPANWSRNGSTPASQISGTSAILDAFRAGSADDVAEFAIAELRSGNLGARDVWDAVHLAAGELMIQQPGIYGIHTVTSTNALRYAYESSSEPTTRLLMLLQGLGWMSQFRKFMSGNPQGLGASRITDLRLIDNAVPDVDRTFDAVGRDPLVAATQAMSFAGKAENIELFTRTANRLLLRKASDAHDFKYSASLFEDLQLVGLHWRPQMLATATYYLRGTTAPDSPVMKQAREVLSQLPTN